MGPSDRESNELLHKQLINSVAGDLGPAWLTPKRTNAITTSNAKQSFFGLRLVGPTFRVAKPEIKALRAKAKIS